MSNCAFEMIINKKIKLSFFKKNFKFSISVIAFAMVLFSILLLFTGEFDFFEILPVLFIAALMVNYGSKKYKEYKYDCLGSINVTENNEIVFFIKNSNDKNKIVYDLNVKFSKEQINNIYFEIQGVYVSGYPLIEKNNATKKEFVDCLKTEEFVDIHFCFNNENEERDALIKKLDKIIKSVHNNDG